MTAIRFASIGLVLLGGIDGWRRILRRSAAPVSLAADAAVLILGVVLALLAGFPAILWLVLFVLTFPVFVYAWASPNIPLTRAEAKRQMRPQDQMNLTGQDATKVTRLFAWASLASAAAVLLAGAVSVAWGTTSVVAKVVLLVLLAVAALVVVILGLLIWKTRRSSAQT
jgi:hypothetical protein